MVMHLKGENHMGQTLTIIKDFYRSKYAKAGTVALALLMAAFVVIGFQQQQSSAAIGGPTCNVPADYATIQAAVDAVGCTTVKVAPGNYTESVSVARAVNIKGAKAGVNVNSRTFGSTAESKVTGATGAVFTVNAADVTIDGFSLTNPGQGLGVVVKTPGNRAFIKNNIVDTIGGATYAPNAVGIYLELGPDSVKVVSNKLTNIESVASAQGVLVGDSTSSNPSLDILLKKNTISKVTSTRGAYGIQLNNGASTAPTATGYTEARVIDNEIKDLKGDWAHGIGLEGETPNVVVTYNTVSNLTDVNSTSINDAIAVFFESNPFFFTAEVNRNSIAVGPTAYGIAVHPALTLQYSSLNLDGECNWWGAANGPGAIGTGNGSLVSAGVDYTPWLRSNDLDRRCDNKSHGHNSDDHHFGRDNDWWDKRD